ncbi:MAG: hypothetical protein NTW45_07500 [Rhodocyclales bacterium]|nr:hypothetical protein [Rhodocyclales bacterium]
MMNFALLAGIGWRDVVLLLAAMTGVYLVLSVMRLFEMAAKRRDLMQPASGPGLSAWEPHFVPQVQTPQPGQLSPELARMLEQARIEAELQRLRSENMRLNEVLANVAEDVARLKAARDMAPACGEAIALAPQGMPAGAMGGPRNYRLLRHLQRRGATAGCANTQPYEFERHEQGEDRNGRNIVSGPRAQA